MNSKLQTLYGLQRWTLAVLCGLVCAACNPDALINEYFAKLGLNRLSAVRTDLLPGGVVVVDGNRAVYADNIADYADAENTPYELHSRNGMSEYQAVAARYKGTSRISGSLAFGFLNSLLPVSLGTDLKLTADVTIEPGNVRVRRMKIPAIKTYLTDKASRGFREFAIGEMDKGRKVFLAYETWQSSRIKVSSEAGRDVTSSLKLNEVKPLKGGDAKFEARRTSATTLEIDGDALYVFAVRTARLKKGRQSGQVDVELTEFARPAEWGIKAAGTDEDYSAPLTSTFVPIAIGR